MPSMSSLLGSIARLPVLCTFRQTVFFSSITTLFDKYLVSSRKIARDKLKGRGFPSNISTTASGFDLKDLQLLKVNFQPTPFKNDILPNVDVSDFPEEYILPNISKKELLDTSFNVESFKEISDHQVQAFLTDLHEVIKDLHSNEGMEGSETDTLVYNLLFQIVGLHRYPLKIRLYIASECYMIAKPEFVINRKNISMIVIEGKHIKNKNLIPSKGYGEARLAAEILACANENMLHTAHQTDVILDQIIFAVRVVSTYFTFYKAIIPSGYWNELGYGLLKKESIIIKRWPEDMRPASGLVIVEPSGRQNVLKAFFKI
ncbi:8081_t:CDS:2, partial [Dentiscutata erythropus]